MSPSCPLSGEQRTSAGTPKTPLLTHKRHRSATIAVLHKHVHKLKHQPGNRPESCARRHVRRRPQVTWIIFIVIKLSSIIDWLKRVELVVITVIP